MKMPLVYGEPERVCWNCGSPELRLAFHNGVEYEVCDDCDEIQEEDE